MSMTVQELYTFALRLADNLEETDREQFERLIQLRENVLMELSNNKDVSEADKAKLRDIGTFDSLFTERMLQIKNEASDQLQKIQNFRFQKKMYEQAYSAGSYFIDKKK